MENFYFVGKVRKGPLTFPTSRISACGGSFKKLFMFDYSLTSATNKRVPKEKTSTSETGVQSLTILSHKDIA